MTILHPFRNRHSDDDVAELRRKVHMLNVIVDDIIDAWPSLPVHELTSEHRRTSEALVVTGPIRGQEMTLLGWSCSDPGRDLTVDQAKAVTRQHLCCPGDNPRVCRVKDAAMAKLAAAGVLVRDSRRNYSIA
jgi:hypothetical protein